MRHNFKFLSGLLVACLFFSACGLKSRGDLTVANPGGTASIATFRQTVTSLEVMTGVQASTVTALNTYVGIALQFLSAEGGVDSLTPTFLLVSVGVIGGYCIEGAKKTITTAEAQRTFLKRSLAGVTGATELSALDASRSESIGNELGKVCLNRSLSTEEQSILQAFVAKTKSEAAGTGPADFQSVVGQMCTAICASFDALRI